MRVGDRLNRLGSAIARHARWQVTTVVVFGLAVWAFLAVAAERHGFFDLQVYYGAMHHWASGHDVYGFLRPGSKYGFTYPPVAALAMLPMALVGWETAIAINVTLNVLCSVAVIFWLVDPLSRRMGWTRWFACAMAVGFAAAYEPLRETINFGQVNMVLVFLVLADLLLLVAPGRRLAGIGIGLATAIKLTPGIFILYLLITRRFRAAGVAVAIATAATVLAAAVLPDESRVFWTDAVWNTDRIGARSFISNQSLQGVLARLSLDGRLTSALWLVLVVAALAIWARRARAAVAAGDELVGFTLTGIVACLVSPFTWVHHLVWVMPAFPLLVDAALGVSTTPRRRRGLLVFAVVGYLLLCSRLVWAFGSHFGGWGLLGANAYALLCVALLVVLPVRSTGGVEGGAKLGHGHAGRGERLGGAVGDETVAPVEAARPLVRVKDP